MEHPSPLRRIQSFLADSARRALQDLGRLLDVVEVLGVHVLLLVL
jgi:hypothetical protein